jgi:hypothetical protein
MAYKHIYRTLYIGLYVCVALTLLYLISHASYTEGFQNSTLYPVCFLTVSPQEDYLDFLLGFTLTQPVYVVCDNNEYAPPEQIKSKNYTAVVITEVDAPATHHITPNTLYFLKIADDTCGKRGFLNTNNAVPKTPSAWDKALYYFCLKNMAEHVWFVEEDVFIPRATILDEINVKYPTTDLVTKQHVLEKDDPEFYWWFDGEGKMDRPYYRSLVCASRISRRLLDLVGKMAKEKRTVCFLEILFNSLAHNNGFTIEQIPELQSIIFRHNWTKDTVHMNGLFHPVKNIEEQTEFRRYLESKSNGRQVLR